VGTALTNHNPEKKVHNEKKSLTAVFEATIERVKTVVYGK
jgi:hypothetical protein